MSDAALEHDPNVPELSALAIDAIESWQRTLANAQGDRVPIFREACRELVRLAIDHTEVNAADVIFAELDAMAAPAGIRLYEAERIVAEVRREIDDGQTIIDAWERQDRRHNGVVVRGDEPPPPRSPDDYGAGTLATPEPLQPAAFITPAHWPDQAPPPVDWLAFQRIPRGDVTTLSGDGGLGKTDLALRLAANVSRSAPDWLGFEIAEGPVVFISAEEPEREIRRRIWLHGEHDGYSSADLTNLFIWAPDEAAPDTILAIADRQSSIMRPTPLFDSIAVAIRDRQPSLVVVDNVAATFAGEQNNRVSARTYVRLWQAVARIDSKPAVLLLDHPSLSGLTNNTGRGGSMDWRNAVRSALYLYPAPDTADADRGVRILETTKSNYGPSGKATQLRLQWADGGLERETGALPHHRAAKEQQCDEIFLRLLDERAAQGGHVGRKTSGMYAPKVFAAAPDNGGFAKSAFALAMERLFAAGTIREAWDPKRRHDYIERATAE